MINRTKFTIIIYDGQKAVRGRPDLTMEQFELKAPVAIAGETKLPESAHIERVIIVNPMKKTLTNKTNKTYKILFKRLEKKDLLGFAERYIRWTLEMDFEATYKKAESIIKENTELEL